MTILVIVLLGLSGCSDSEDVKKKHNIIKRDGYVYFTLGDRDFVIPEGNFKGGTETGGGELVRATLRGLLPDFEGYDKEKNHDEFAEEGKGKGWGRRAYIELYRRTERVSIQRMLERWSDPVRKSAISGRVGQYDEIRHGLEYYRSKNNSDDVYLYVEEKRPIMFIKCPSESVLKTRPSPSCTYHWDISDGTSYEMWYSMGYLPQWREIWGNVKRLLNADK